MRNDNTALTPSAFRKKVYGLRPLTESHDKPPWPSTEFISVLDPELAEPGIAEAVPLVTPELLEFMVDAVESEAGVVMVVPPCPPGVV